MKTIILFSKYIVSLIMVWMMCVEKVDAQIIKLEKNATNDNPISNGNENPMKTNVSSEIEVMKVDNAFSFLEVDIKNTRNEHLRIIDQRKLKKRQKKVNLNSKFLKSIICCLWKGLHTNVMRYTNDGSDGEFKVKLLHNKNPNWNTSYVRLFECIERYLGSGKLERYKCKKTYYNECKQRFKANMRRLVVKKCLVFLGEEKLNNNGRERRYRMNLSEEFLSDLFQSKEKMDEVALHMENDCAIPENSSSITGTFPEGDVINYEHPPDPQSGGGAPRCPSIKPEQGRGGGATRSRCDPSPKSIGSEESPDKRSQVYSLTTDTSSLASAFPQENDNYYNMSVEAQSMQAESVERCVENALPEIFGNKCVKTVSAIPPNYLLTNSTRTSNGFIEADSLYHETVSLPGYHLINNGVVPDSSPDTSFEYEYRLHSPAESLTYLCNLPPDNVENLFDEWSSLHSGDEESYDLNFLPNDYDAKTVLNHQDPMFSSTAEVSMQ